MLNLVRAHWDVTSAIVIASFAAVTLPANAICSVSTELITFFGIQSAIILPAMIFTAGILRPNGLEVSDARRYHKALKQQMLFWVTLLVLDFIAVVILILGKGLNWQLAVTLPRIDTPVDLSNWLNFLFFGVGSLAVLRTIPFIKGVLSLLDLNADMTLSAIQRRNRQETVARNRETPPEPIDLPEGYGELSEEK